MNGSIRRTRQGTTLLELLISAALGVTVLGGAWFLLHTGVRAALHGMAAAGVLTGITTFTEVLGADLDQLVAGPAHHGGCPVRVALNGHRVAFLVPARDRMKPVLTDGGPTIPGQVSVAPSGLSTAELGVCGVPVLWRVEPSPGGFLVPVRNGRALAGVLLTACSFEMAGTSDDLEVDPEREETDTQLMKSVLLVPPAGRGGAVPVGGLTLRFTAVDPERRVSESRVIVYPLENANLHCGPGAPFALPVAYRAVPQEPRR